MPAPTQMSDLSTTAASNTPAGGEAIGTSLDDYLRGVQAVIRLEQSNGTIASAATTDLSTINEKSIAVTGTTTITSLGTESAGITKQLRFAGALTLTHSASLYLIGAANITTVAEDVADFLSLGSGNWKMTGYSRALTTSVTASQISDSTAAGRAVLTAANAAAQLVTLGAVATASGTATSLLLNELKQDVTAIASLTVDLSLGLIVNLAQAVSITTLAFSNVPTTGKAVTITIVRTKDATGTARTIAWPASVKWSGGAPTLTSTASCIDIIQLVTIDGGTTYFASSALNFS